MLLPCIKCYCYGDQTFTIKIGDNQIQECICGSCRESIQDDFENLIMKWTLGFFNENIIYKKKSAFSSIYVTENDEQRNLRFLTSFQSGVLKKEEGTSTPYLNSFLAGPLFLNRKIKKILCIGLGTGYLVKLFRRFFPDVQVDVVEIDEEVYSIAKRYFDFCEDEKTRVYISDAYDFVQESKSTDYDLIALDAYDGYEVPDQLDSIDFYKKINHILLSDGLLITNLHGRFSGEYSDNFRKSYNKISRVLPHSIFFPSPNEWEMNILTLSSRNPIKKTNINYKIFPPAAKKIIEPWINGDYYTDKDI